MTQMMMNIDAEGNIYFDCRNHAGKVDVCIMASTLCNVLIMACKALGIEPKEEADAHITFDIIEAPDSLVQTFKAVHKVFCEIENQFPFYMKVY